MPIQAPLVLDHPMRVALLAAELVANRLRARSRPRLILPTGQKPHGVYAALRAYAADGSMSAAGATLFQLDEHLGLAPGDERSCAAGLRHDLTGLRFGTVNWLDGAAADPVAEGKRHQALLDGEPIDLAVVAIGADGHAALAGDGAIPVEGLSSGMRTLMNAREVVVLATGGETAQALQAMLEGGRGVESPTAPLRDHPRLSVICDAAAARLLAPRPGRASDRVVVVLGHRDPGVSSDDHVSDESRSRLERAARACASDPPRAVIFTGWSRTPDGLSEAEQMKAAWTATDTPALLEEGGRNTSENASCSLPLVRAIGEIRRVTVVTSVWHLRTPYFFAPYRALGLRLSFAPDLSRPWLEPLRGELRNARNMRAERRDAMARMRLPGPMESPPAPALTRA